MTPTNRLRFVERVNINNFGKLERVLQQWWNDTGPNGGPDVGVWRDVPLEAE